MFAPTDWGSLVFKGEKSTSRRLEKSVPLWFGILLALCWRLVVVVVVVMKVMVKVMVNVMMVMWF